LAFLRSRLLLAQIHLVRPPNRPSPPLVLIPSARL